MSWWPRLNERQLAVLHRIADEEGDAVSSREPSLAATVYALRGRRLVITPRSSGVWTAEITEAGRYYLQHGRYQPAASPAGRTAAPAPQPPGVPPTTDDDPQVPEPAELLEQLAVDGTVRVESPDTATRAAWRRTVHATRTSGTLPEGKRLRLRGRDTGDLILDLVDAAPADAVSTPPERCVVPEAVETPHPVAAMLCDQLAQAGLTTKLLSRARTILHALAAEAERRGHTVRVADGDGPGMVIVAAGSMYPLI